MPAVADLNKFEANTRGEFGIGSAAQFGSADLRYVIAPYLRGVCCCRRSFVSECEWFEFCMFLVQDGSSCE